MDDDAVEAAGEAHQEREEADYTEKWHVKPQEFGKQVIEDAFIGNRKPVKGSAYEKDPVGLAVEVFMALQDKGPHYDRMTIAINLVKQAQKAFS